MRRRAAKVVSAAITTAIWPALWIAERILRYGPDLWGLPGMVADAEVWRDQWIPWLIQEIEALVGNPWIFLLSITGAVVLMVLAWPDLRQSLRGRARLTASEQNGDRDAESTLVPFQSQDSSGLEFVFRPMPPFLELVRYIDTISTGSEYSIFFSVMVVNHSGSQIRDVRIRLECRCKIAEYGVENDRVLTGPLRPRDLRDEPASFDGGERRMFYIAEQNFKNWPDPKRRDAENVPVFRNTLLTRLFVEGKEPQTLGLYRRSEVRMDLAAYGDGITQDKRTLLLKFDRYGRLTIWPERIGEYPDESGAAV